MPEWDDENKCYGESGFNFRPLLNEDKTVIFDLGALGNQATNIISLLLLSRLWDIAQLETRRSATLGGNDEGFVDDDTVIGCVVEEAKRIANSDIVEDLLSEGREFGLCLGLVMQFPEQVDSAGGAEGGDSAYEEIMTNVRTKILGEDVLAQDLAELLETDQVDADEFRRRLKQLPDGEWIVKLPEAGFLKEKPKPFSIQSLEQPPGHSGGKAPLSEAERQALIKNEAPKMRQRVAQKYCVRHPPDAVSEDNSTESQSGGDQPESEARGESDNNSEPAVDTDTSEPESSSQDSSQDSKGGNASWNTQDMLDENLKDGGGGASETGHNGESGESPIDAPSAGSNKQQHTDRSESAKSEGESGVPDRIDMNPEVDMSGRGTDQDDVSPSGEVTDSASDAEREQHSKPQGAGRAVADSGAVETDEVTGDAESVETSSPFEEGFTPHVDPETVPSLDGVGMREMQFLKLCIDAMNGRVDGYSLTSPMSELPVDRQQINIDRLVEEGLIERHTMAHRVTYYTVADGVRDALGETYVSGNKRGDLGEKAPHRVGVAWFEEYLQDQPGVLDTARYYEIDSGERYDVAGFAFGNELVTVGEVEMVSNNHSAILSDYDSLADTEAAAHWIFKGGDEMQEILKLIFDKRNIDFPVRENRLNRLGSVRGGLDEQTVPGISAVHTLQSLKREGGI